MGCVQQQSIAQEAAQHLTYCLSVPSVAVQLSACKVLKKAASKCSALKHVPQIARKLVKLNGKQGPLSTAPAIECIAILCDQSRENASAAVRASGLHAMLCTLEEDCPAQVQLRY